MKKLLLLFCMIFTFTIANAEKFTYQATACQIETLDDNGDWIESEFLPNDQFILLDFDNDQWRTFGSPEIILNLVEFSDGSKFDDGVYGEMLGLDQDGDLARLSIMSKDDGTVVFCLEYSDIKLYYFGEMIVE